MITCCHVQNALRLQRQRERAEEGEDEAAAQVSNLKQASRKDMYSVCLNAGLGRNKTNKNEICLVTSYQFNIDEFIRRARSLLFEHLPYVLAQRSVIVL